MAVLPGICVLRVQCFAGADLTLCSTSAPCSTAAGGIRSLRIRVREGGTLTRVLLIADDLRRGFGRCASYVSNALLLDQSLPAFIGHNLDKIGDGTVL
jgi:hypothetical protein